MEQSQLLKGILDNIIGDVLLSAGMVSYLGMHAFVRLNVGVFENTGIYASAWWFSLLLLHHHHHHHHDHHHVFLFLSIAFQLQFVFLRSVQKVRRMKSNLDVIFGS